MLSRFMIEQGDLLLTQLQYKTTLKYIMKPTVLRERMEKSIVVHDENHEPMMVNEADMDFKIPGLPHSVVKHAQSTSVRQTSIVYLAAIETKRRKEFYKRPRTLAEINNGHRVLLLLLLHGGVGKVHGGLLIPMKVTMEMNQVLTEQGDLLYKYLEQFFRA